MNKNSKGKGKAPAFPLQTKRSKAARLNPLLAAQQLAALQAENTSLKTALAKAQAEEEYNLDILGTVELHRRFFRLAETLAALATHPDYPKDFKGVDIWLHYYYVCGLARLNSSDFRDEVKGEFKHLPFETVAQQFAEALAQVLEFDDITVSVFNALADLACDIQNLLIFKQTASQQQALRLRLLFSDQARAAFASA